MFIVVLCGCSVFKENTHQFENKNELVFFDINTNADQQTIFCDVNAKNNWSCPLITEKTPIKTKEALAESPVVRTIVAEKIDDVLFGFNESSLTDISKVRLISLLPLLMKGKITLKGYTDSIGSENYNINLSAERVVRVKEFLVETGIRSEMIEAKSFGECCFVAANENDESRALNRRVEIYIEQSRLE